ncbi:MAG: hypothetical protein KatS3mg057_2793 [Herpetosiphonaceae bacterium]|nr:MAG: hypothetical protein KatS3mg057_2793 [Herpetosiphonaceae bacterium]
MQLLSPERRSAALLVQEGAAAIQIGDRARARSLLEQAVAVEPEHEQAWHWLSVAVESEAERRHCLERVIAINPQNLVARQELENLSPQRLPARITRPITPPLSPSETGPAPVVPPRGDRSTRPLFDPADTLPPAIPVPVPPTLMAAAGPSSQQNHTRLLLSRNALRAIPASLYALIFMLFFLPFVTVSCAGQEVSYSGIDLMREDVNIDATRWVVRTVMPEVEPSSTSTRAPAILAFVAAVGGFIASLLPMKAGRIAAAVTGVAGGGALMLLRFGIERQARTSGLEHMIGVSYEFGYWGALVLFLVAAALGALVLVAELRVRNQQPWGTIGPASQGAGKPFDHSPL